MKKGLPLAALGLSLLSLECRTASPRDISSLVTIEPKEVPVTYSPALLEAIYEIFDKKKVEHAVCQLGEKRNGGYVVNGLLAPTIQRSTTSKVVYLISECQKHPDYLGMLHNYFEGKASGLSPPDSARFFQRDTLAEIESIIPPRKTGGPMKIKVTVKDQ